MSYSRESMDEAKYGGFFKALGDDHRLQILRLLSEKQLSAGEILASMDIVQSTLSHHMKVLTDSGVVTAARSGKWTIYSVNMEVMRSASAFLDDFLRTAEHAEQSDIMVKGGTAAGRAKAGADGMAAGRAKAGADSTAAGRAKAGADSAAADRAKAGADGMAAGRAKAGTGADIAETDDAGKNAADVTPAGEDGSSGADRLDAEGGFDAGREKEDDPKSHQTSFEKKKGKKGKKSKKNNKK